ncbi:YpsA SLOG family protein [Simonsiella muelleri]|uniref:YpsA SLOG family protein n=1 Tax=Simonsiella muelleri TaxID=72 RepID=UPI0023F462F2|nr:putative molybdenum carrier protein [Simonsiella muelleri]
MTLKTCISQRKPYLLLDSSVLQPEIAGKHIAEFVQRHQISVLNVGGSRGSVVPTIELFTEKVVLLAIQYLREM